jgi:hypothetical protein
LERADLEQAASDSRYLGKARNVLVKESEGEP